MVSPSYSSAILAPPTPFLLKCTAKCSVTHTRIYTYMYTHTDIYIYIYSFSVSFPYRLLQDIEYRSLCYRVGPIVFLFYR